MGHYVRQILEHRDWDMSRKKTLNLHNDQHNELGQALCPLRDVWFGFNNCIVRSIDGFMCTLRLKPLDNRRIMTLMDGAYRAKIAVKNIAPADTVWWNGKDIDVDSPEYERLLERMLRARFRKDEAALAALRMSHGLKLVHKRPTHASKLSLMPARLYCKLLTRIRSELIQTGEIAPSAS